MRWLLSLFLFTIPSGFTLAQPKVLDGFKVELILQAPDIEAPTALAVAPNGDVYYAEDPMDMTGPPTQNLDKIYLLKNGDPKQKILIAEKMWAVMGMELVRDKLYVVHPPHVTVFTLDKEGKPIKREEIFDDLGPKVAGAPGFNDHVPSGIRMGMDGWLYVSIGDKGIPKMSRIPIGLRGTDKAKQIEAEGSVHVAEGRHRRVKEGHHISLEGGGVIRFRPDGTHLEVFASGTRNHLDVPMDEHDRIFVRDNTDDGLGWNTRLMYLPKGAFMGYPWAYKQRPDECLPAITDFGGGSPCGGWVYCDDGLPESLRGRIFHCEWGKQKIGAVRVKPTGAGFEFVDEIDFMLPGELKDFRPFTLRPTHDGRGFYITDWAYNGWSAKVKAGRLWKVTYTKDDVKPKPRGKNDDSVEKLIEALGHPAHSERLRAQWELEVMLAGPEIRKSDAEELLKRILRHAELTKKASRPTLVAARHLLWCLRNRNVPGADEADTLSPKDILTAWRKNQLNREERAELYPEVLKLLASFWERPETSLQKARHDAWGDVANFVISEFIDKSKARPEIVRLLNALLTESNRDFGIIIADPLDPTVVEKDPFLAPLHAKVVRLIANARGTMKLLEKAKLLEAGVLLGSFRESFDLSVPEEIRSKFDSCTDASIRVRLIEILARQAKDRPLYDGGWWGTQPANQKPPARTIAWEGTPLIRDALLKALDDKDAGVRQAALKGLTDLQDPETLRPLAKRLETHKELELVRAIAALKLPQAASILSQEADNEKNPEALRLEAIKGLESLGNKQAIDSLIFSGMDASSEKLRAAAIDSLGNLKAKIAQPVFVKGIKDNSASIRKSSVLAISKLNDPALGRRILPLLQDTDSGVVLATIQSIGIFQFKDAIPLLLPFVNQEATRFDTLLTLSKMPDVQAMSAYLLGLESKNNDLRVACRLALTTIREPAAKVLEELAKRNEIRPEILGELRTIYTAFQPITTWNLIGPFADMNKPQPPEKEINLDATYPGDGKDVKWRKDKKADPKTGRINLQSLFFPNNNTSAYAYAEIESTTDREANVAIGSDDSCTVWLNGKQVFHFGGNRGWNPNQDQVSVKLQKGKNAILVKIGNNSGPWDFSVAISGETSQYAFLKGSTAKLSLEEFRKFARSNKGDGTRGEKLFMDEKGLACIKCHALNGKGGTVGPEITGIALKYNKEDLMTSILEPSKNIANGYETVRITTLDGKTIQGVFKGETGENINLADEKGMLISIAKKDVEEKKISPVSLMPNGLNEGMSLQDFADLIAYLEARREGKK
jgi:putative heme-binding domain-containing protein